MRESYGEVILKKDFILYHTSDNLFKNKPNHPMLFCTFHPSEWFYGEDFITIIKLKKDVSLFFMLDFDYSITLSSYLPIFTNLSIHLHKINHTNSQLLFYYNELKNKGKIYFKKSFLEIYKIFKNMSKKIHKNLYPILIFATTVLLRTIFIF